jgi:hypothetical protein
MIGPSSPTSRQPPPPPVPPTHILNTYKYVFMYRNKLVNFEAKIFEICGKKEFRKLGKEEEPYV